MSSDQKSLHSYFTKKRNVEELNNDLPKRNRTCGGDTNVIINDNSINTIIDMTVNVHTMPNTESSCDFESNIIEDFSSKTNTLTIIDKQKRTYKPWYSNDFTWLIYESNIGGFCSICRDYWKSTAAGYSEMLTRTRGVFVTEPFTNWKCAPGKSGRLQKHHISTYHKTATHNLAFRQQEGSVVQQLLNLNELERQENRERFGDLLEAAYFLFKNELPHTTLYESLLKLLSTVDHSQKLSSFFKNCQKNATYNSTTTITELLESTGEIIDEQISSKIRQAKIISIMADEGTDINHHQNLSICIRYCNQDTGE